MTETNTPELITNLLDALANLELIENSIDKDAEIKRQKDIAIRKLTALGVVSNADR